MELSDTALIVYLKTLVLRQFKNYERTQFEFSPALTFITGENGSGKTNLLDAIHYLCLGKSYFHSTDQQAILHGVDFFRIEGQFLRSDEKINISCTYPVNGKKELSRNGKVYPRLTDHVGLLPVVMITPDDQSLIDEGSDERRRFTDNTISQIDHLYLEDLVSYNKVLQQRNAMLKQFAFRKTLDSKLIETLDEQLAALGEKIFTKRQSFLGQMIPLITKFYAIVSGEKEQVTATYDSVFLHRSYLDALKNSIERDLQLERTTEGIHRDEFEFRMNNRPVKKFGSQGQKKSFLVALKMAQWELIRSEKNIAPLLLVDDLSDKLDQSRSSRILQLITGGDFGQVFATDTDEEKIRNSQTENSYFIVTAGKVSVKSKNA